jgi:hypothetical protein
MRNRNTITCLQLAVAASAAQAGAPLVPPEVVDMKIIGQMGTYTNAITSDLLLNGNYLYCSLIWGGGLKTLNVSDPTNMVLTSEWSDGGGGSGQAYGLAMRGTVLYMANWSPNHGLRVFSIANPAQPALIRTLSTTVHAWELCIEGNLLFVVVSNGYDVAGIDIYDITTPGSPQFVTFLQSPHRLVGRPAALGSHLYMVSNHWMRVYNVSNPSSPSLIRQLNFNARTGTGALDIKDGYLYMRADDDTYPEPDWLDGGLYVFSLNDPSNPQQVSFFERPMSKDMHLQDRYGLLPAGGNGLYGLDISDPLNITQLWHVGVEWPGTGPGGYEECVAGSGDYRFVGVVESNGCTQCGARVYALRIQVPMPPVIKEVAPDPAGIFAAQPYMRQLVLLQGMPLPDWTVVQGPSGTQVDNNGLVSGWSPAAADIGSTLTLQIRATNVDGFDDESWRVRVNSIADFDHDDDVDQEDFGHFQSCLAGGSVYPAGCDDADFNQDTHVETADLELFQACYAGPGNPPGC